jgi:hypothetical protein
MPEKLFNEGKTEEEVVAAKPLADLDGKWAAGSRDKSGAKSRRVRDYFLCPFQSSNPTAILLTV